MPRDLESNCVFVWLDWPQSKVPFTPEEKRVIQNLDIEEKKSQIREAFPDFSNESLDTMEVSMAFLKHGVKQGLTAYEIGCFFTTIRTEDGSVESIMKRVWNECKRNSPSNAMKIFHQVAPAIIKKYLEVRGQQEEGIRMELSERDIETSDSNIGNRLFPISTGSKTTYPPTHIVLNRHFTTMIEPIIREVT